MPTAQNKKQSSATVEATSNETKLVNNIRNSVDDDNIESKSNKKVNLDSKNLRSDSSNLTNIDWHRAEDGTYSANCYINRELSWLQFHLRVLAQATNPSHPLLERLFFLIIFSSNMDEFFEIRVAGVMQQMNHGNLSTTPDGLKPSDVLAEISRISHEAITEQYRILNEEILPEMAKQDIRYLKRDELNTEQAAWMKAYFINQVLP